MLTLFTSLGIQGRANIDLQILEALISSLLPALVILGVSTWFGRRGEGSLKRLEARLQSKTGYWLRKLEAHEELWPLVAECNRAQSSMLSAKKSNQQHGSSIDVAPLAKRIAGARSNMKNFVYNRVLYFDHEMRMLVQSLDTALADPKVDHVKTQIDALESKLHELVTEFV